VDHPEPGEDDAHHRMADQEVRIAHSHAFIDVPALRVAEPEARQGDEGL
jgi:hypothetical protein